MCSVNMMDKIRVYVIYKNWLQKYLLLDLQSVT